MSVRKEEIELIENIWKFFPDTYAQVKSKGSWKPYPHLTFISEKLFWAILKGGARIIVSLPPRHGKSEFISKWLAAWFLDTFAKNLILVTYGQELSNDFGRWLRNYFLDQESLQESGALVKNRKKSTKSFTLNNGASFFATGIGGPLTGRGGSLILIDDPVKNWEEANSETYRRKIKEWYRATLSTRLEPGGSVILILTRWHSDDLAGYLLNDHDENWTYLKFQGLAEGGQDLLGRKEGEPLCPERYSREDLLRIKAGLSPIEWAALYQQQPTTLGAEVIKTNFFKYYTDLPLKFERLVQFWDCANKPGVTNDFSVCATWGLLDGCYYLLDIFRDRLSYPDLEKKAVVLYNFYSPDVVVIEDKSAGISLIQALLVYKIPVFAFNPKGDKIQRMLRVTPRIESGFCFLPKKASFLSDFLIECQQFPYAKHDDQVDTLSMMLEYFREKEDIKKPRIRQL